MVDKICRTAFLVDLVDWLKEKAPIFLGKKKLLESLIQDISQMVIDIMDLSWYKSDKMKCRIVLRVIEVLAIKYYSEGKWNVNIALEKLLWNFWSFREEYKLWIDLIFKKLGAINKEIEKYNSIIDRWIKISNLRTKRRAIEVIWRKQWWIHDVFNLKNINFKLYPGDLKIESSLWELLELREETLFKTVSTAIFIWSIPLNIFEEIDESFDYMWSNYFNSRKINISLVEGSIKSVILQYFAIKNKIKLSSFFFPKELEIEKIERELWTVDFNGELIEEIVEFVANIIINEEQLKWINSRYWDYYKEWLKSEIKSILIDIISSLDKEWWLKKSFITYEFVQQFKVKKQFFNPEWIMIFRELDKELINECGNLLEDDIDYDKLFFCFEKNNNYWIIGVLFENLSIPVILRIISKYYLYLFSNYWESNWKEMIRKFMNSFFKCIISLSSKLFYHKMSDNMNKSSYNNRLYSFFLYLGYWISNWKIVRSKEIKSELLGIQENVLLAIDSLINSILNENYSTYLYNFNKNTDFMVWKIISNERWIHDFKKFKEILDNLIPDT